MIFISNFIIELWLKLLLKQP